MSEHQILNLLQAEFAPDIASKSQPYWGIPFFWCIPCVCLIGLLVVVNSKKISDGLGAILGLSLLGLMIASFIAGVYNIAAIQSRDESRRLFYEEKIPAVSKVVSSERGYMVVRKTPSWCSDYDAIINPESTITINTTNGISSFKLNEVEDIVTGKQIGRAHV